MEQLRCRWTDFHETLHSAFLKIQGVRARGIQNVEIITPHMLINTWEELEYRLISVELQQVPTLKCTDVFSYSVHC
jgi:hypothetical protein